MVGTSAALPIFSAEPRHRLSAIAALGGGLMIVVGSFLPWMTLFAGLHPYAGVLGLNGKLLAAGGALSMLLGIWLLLRGGQNLNRVLGALGVTLLASTVWLLLRQHQAYQELLSGHPMMVPGIGSGLYVAASGALLVSTALWIGRDRVSPGRPKR
jgi:hypothetical protein